MSDRITQLRGPHPHRRPRSQRDVEAVCNRINRTLNGPNDHETDTSRWATGRVTNGSYEQIPNVYYIDSAYGGVALYRTCSANGDGESHGVHDVFGSGHMPKRELYERMQAFLRGIETVA